MNTYKVTFESIYPGAKDNICTAYVLAESFKDAETKCKNRYESDDVRVQAHAIELLVADIIV